MLESGLYDLTTSRTNSGHRASALHLAARNGHFQVVQLTKVLIELKFHFEKLLII